MRHWEEAVAFFPVSPARDLEYIGFVPAGETPVSGANTFAVVPFIAQRPAAALGTDPWQNSNTFFRPFWMRRGAPSAPGVPIYIPTWIMDYDGYVAMPMGGCQGRSGLSVLDATHSLHYWGGARGSDPNLVQGLYFVAYAPDEASVVSSWFSSNGSPGAEGFTDGPIPGVGSGDRKDFRSFVNQAAVPANNLQALRVGLSPPNRDCETIFLSTPGGSVYVVAPGSSPADRGGILGQASGSPDDGFGAPALALRDVQDGVVDVFVGTTFHHADPVPHSLPLGLRGPGPIVGSVRWLRWDGAVLSPVDQWIFDPSGGGERGGFGVAGLAVGDIIQGPEAPGEEVVVTTFDGDLFVLQADTVVNPTGFVHPPLFRTWLPGSLGAYNSIVIADLDGDQKNEMYLGGSMGVWKFRQP